MTLQNKANYLSGKMQEFDDMGAMLTNEGSNLNDEQLLEGLPTDDFGGRLF